jgi:hypothetical protein
MATAVKSKPSFSPGRKWSIGVNVGLIVVVVFAVVGMINYLSRDYFLRYHWSDQARAELSPLTVKFVKSVTNHVRVIVYYKKTDSLYPIIAALLNEYKLINPRIKVEPVDYLRDPATAQKIKEDYKLSLVTEKNLVIFDCAGKHLQVDGTSLAKYVLEQIPSEKDPEFQRKPTEFYGERMFTSALIAVTNLKPLNACVLQGHFEHPISSGDSDYGYLKFRNVLEQNYINVQPLSLLGSNNVPMDCHLLIIPGSRDKLSQPELDKIEQYVNQGGRLFALFNGISAAKETGLEKILAKWGVDVGASTVVDYENFATKPGTDVIVRDFSNHQIVNPLLTSGLYLARPRPIMKIKSGVPADQARVEELAFSSPKSVLTDNLNAAPKRYPLIVAVEKSSIQGVSPERGTTRMVVVGDSLFLANYTIESAANRDFLGYVVNWLLDRTQLLEAIGPRAINEYRLVMSPLQLQRAQWIMLGGLPGSVLLLGGLVCLRRRK